MARSHTNLQHITAKTVASAFVSGWIAHFGVPSTVTIDHGCQFESSLWDQLTCRTILSIAHLIRLIMFFVLLALQEVYLLYIGLTMFIIEPVRMNCNAVFFLDECCKSQIKTKNQ